jgi:hypothetical protein
MVVDRIYQVRNNDIANLTVVEGDDGLIVIDCTTGVEPAAQGMAPCLANTWPTSRLPLPARPDVEVLDDWLLGRGSTRVYSSCSTRTERVQVRETRREAVLGNVPHCWSLATCLRQPVAWPSGPAVQTDSDERLRCSTYFSLRER